MFTSDLIRRGSHPTMRSDDLVIALGGPERAMELPAIFMYSYSFTRTQIGIGASSAIIMLLMIASVIVPYLYFEIKARSRDVHK